MNWSRSIAIVLGMALFSPVSSMAERLALVIGNEAYEKATRLSNPVRDAELVAQVLKNRLGFDEVRVLANLGKRDMELALSAFIHDSAGAEVAFIYYSGHGMQPSTGGKSFLLPVNADVSNDRELEVDGISAERVVEELEGQAKPAKVRVVVLDACRNSPFGRRVKGDVKGLAPVRPMDQYTLVAYATKDGDVAQDGTAENSPYARSLAKWLERAQTMPLRLIFENTAEDVKRATGQLQKPRTYGDLPSNVLLSGEVARQEAVSLPTPMADSPSAPKVFRDCTECPELVEIPAGRFDMGSHEAGESDLWEGEGPLHQVEVPRFALGRYELTKGEYRRFAQETQHQTGACQDWDGRRWVDTEQTWELPGFFQRDDHPVVCVNWEDARAYAAWLREKTGKAFRLASEAEWEYAARAGMGGMTYWDAEPDDACEHANVWDLKAQKQDPEAESFFECDDDHEETARVGRFRGNTFGLKDMLGNVAEWVEDCWNETYVGAPAGGSAWRTGDCSLHVIRGGSWITNPLGVRFAGRETQSIEVRRPHTGFRLARDLP